jgi:glycosyltransferase involved in cell wall biosynthesis
MRVLHITSAYPYSDHGVYGIFVKEQVESLESLGICNEVCFINARQQGSAQYFKSLPQIRRLSQNCDIVHCHHPYSGMAYLLATGGNRPMVYSHLGDIEKPPSLINGLFQKISCARASAVIFKSNPNARRYPDHYYYLPNGVNTEMFRPMDKNEAKRQLGLDVHKKYILFVSAVGTANPVKRYDKYRDAMALLKSPVADVEELVMAGVRRDMTPLYFNACEALLLTSDQEGSPNVVKESLACGVPVVSTDVGNVRLLLKGCRASFVSETGTAENMAALLDQSLRITERNERAMIFEKRLDMKSVAQELTRIYQQIYQK